MHTGGPPRVMGSAPMSQEATAAAAANAAAAAAAAVLQGAGRQPSAETVEQVLPSRRSLSLVHVQRWQRRQIPAVQCMVCTSDISLSLWSSGCVLRRAPMSSDSFMDASIEAPSERQLPGLARRC